jgi:hypothetical protein
MYSREGRLAASACSTGPARGSFGGWGRGSRVGQGREPPRHRQPKGAGTDMLGLMPPRHTSTPPTAVVRFAQIPVIHRVRLWLSFVQRQRISRNGSASTLNVNWGASSVSQATPPAGGPGPCRYLVGHRPSHPSRSSRLGPREHSRRRGASRLYVRSASGLSFFGMMSKPAPSKALKAANANS